MLVFGRAAFSGRALFRISRMDGVIDFAEGNSAFEGDSGTVLVFGAERGRPIAEPAELPLHRAELGLDLDVLTLQFVTANRITSDAQRRGLAEQQILQAGILPSLHITETMTPGRFFFIWIGVT